MLLPFASYQRKLPAQGMRLVNCYAEQNPLPIKGPISLLRQPGIRSHKNVGSGPGRGLQVHNGGLYAVSGTRLYSVPKFGAGGVPTNLGAIAGAERCSLASNGLVLVVVSRPLGFVYNGVTVAQITDSDFTSRGASKVDYADGYFVFPEPGTGRFFSSDLFATTFDALKFATAEVLPDRLVDLIVNRRLVFLLGEQSTEQYWNSGANNFPFEAVSGGSSEVGGIGGLGKIDNAETWFANDKTVRQWRGDAAIRVSQHGVEEKLRTYSSVPVAFSYKIEGHEFFVERFDEATWVLDANTKEWTERESGNGLTWRVIDCVELGGLYYVQDAATGKVGVIDPTVFDEWGEPLRVVFTTPTIYHEGRYVFHNRLELDIKVGVGLPAGQGSDPEIMLEHSDDGLTWVALESRKLGPIGNYTYRVFWTELGRAINRVYRWSVSDPVEVVAMGWHLDFELGERAA